MKPDNAGFAKDVVLGVIAFAVAIVPMMTPGYDHKQLFVLVMILLLLSIIIMIIAWWRFEVALDKIHIVLEKFDRINVRMKMSSNSVSETRIESENGPKNEA